MTAKLIALTDGQLAYLQRLVRADIRKSRRTREPNVAKLKEKLGDRFDPELFKDRTPEREDVYRALGKDPSKIRAGRDD